MDNLSGMASNGGLDETVEQLRERLAAMKRLVGEDLVQQRARRQREGKKRVINSDSIIDGTFLSVVFTIVLVLILMVSGYAFVNLYYAVLKKFPSREHTEL